MKRSRGLFALLVGVALVTTAAVVVLTASASTKSVTPIPAFSASQLTAAPGDDWITSRGDIYNRQFSSLSDINQSNVSGLKLAWHTRVAVPGKKVTYKGSSIEGEPVVYGGTMFLPDNNGDVYE